MADKKWARNASAFLVVYSILAAIGIVVLTTIIAAGDDSNLTKFWVFTIAPLAFSIFLFIYSGEKILDAMDEDDAYKYATLLNVYNLAVVLLFLGVSCTIYFRYLYTPGWGWCQICRIAGITIAFFMASGHWLGHIRWLFRSSDSEFENYISELEERIEVTEKNRQLGYKIFFWIRRRVAKKDRLVEFAELSYQLQRSNISGIGLFAAKSYQPGELIAEGINNHDLQNIVYWKEVEGVSPSIKEKINQFCIGTPQGFVPPPDNNFNELTPEWYMNHHCHGNVGFDDDGNFVAIRFIQTGEELTYDYGLAESNPNFSMTCNCGDSDCRKVVTGNDWRNPEFRKRHLNIMHPYLRSRPLTISK